MADENFPPKRVTAQVIDYWIGSTAAGLAQAEILFQFELDGKPQNLIWYGSFKEKALGITLKTLLYCGLKGDDPSLIAEGKEGGALVLGRELELVLNRELDLNNNPRLKIKWVNPPLNPPKKRRFSRDEVQGSLCQLTQAMAKARAETGILN